MAGGIVVALYFVAVIVFKVAIFLIVALLIEGGMVAASVFEAASTIGEVCCALPLKLQVFSLSFSTRDSLCCNSFFFPPVSFGITIKFRNVAGPKICIGILKYLHDPLSSTTHGFLLTVRDNSGDYRQGGPSQNFAFPREHMIIKAFFHHLLPSFVARTCKGPRAPRGN